MTTSIIEVIKSKIDVVDEISMVIHLQKSGKSFKGLCPFHNERTPSFYVFQESQSWHCFGCNEGGDVFSFVQKQQNFDFRETLRYLAEKVGLPVEEYSNGDETEEHETAQARGRLLKLNEDALLWFHQMLLRSRESQSARAYVAERGISSDSIVAFSLGYASEKWDGLTRYLVDQGYSEQELVFAGLARWRESDVLGGERRGIYDYFRQRLIFPIRDIRGRVIGFGGRALGETKPKYLNSPQTLLFEKNTVLYAIDMAKDAIKKIGQVVIVEGYVDAVIAHQYGTRQTVAICGSAVTEKHIQQVKRLTKQVTLALDPDEAGSAATEQGIQEAMKGFDRVVVPVPLAASASSQKRALYQDHRVSKSSDGFSRQKKAPQNRGIIRLEEQVDAEINILKLPDGQDPDQVIRNDFSTWLYAVTHPLPLVDYYFAVRTENLNLREPVGKTEAARRLLPVIASISDRIKRDAYIRKLASMIKVEEKNLYAELESIVRYQKTGVNADFSGHIIPTVPGKSEQHTDSANQPGVVFEQEEKSLPASPNPRLDREEQNKLKWEDYLIGLLLQNRDLSPHVCAIINEDDFTGTDTRELYHILNSMYQRDASPLYQPFDEFVPSALMPAVSRALQSFEAGTPGEGRPLEKEAVQCATRLKRERLLQLNKDLKFLIDDAANAGDYATVRQFMQQTRAIVQQIRTIDTATHLQG